MGSHRLIFATLAALCAAGPASSQTIRIPDFRQQPSLIQVKAGERCNDCGRIVSVREVAVERKAEVPSQFQGATRGTGTSNLVGAVVYLPLSDRAGDKPFIGGVGTPEMRDRFGEPTYDMTVRMDDGTTRFVERRDGTRFRVGDRVRSSGPGELELVVD